MHLIAAARSLLLVTLHSRRSFTLSLLPLAPCSLSLSKLAAPLRAPCSPLAARTRSARGSRSPQLDGLTRQSGPVSDLIFPIPHLISYISGIFTLHPGDIILTGTPDGVDLLRPGQKVTASMRLGGEVLDTIEMEVVQRQGGFQRVQHWAEGLPR